MNFKEDLLPKIIGWSLTGLVALLVLPATFFMLLIALAMIIMAMLLGISAIPLGILALILKSTKILGPGPYSPFIAKIRENMHVTEILKPDDDISVKFTIPGKDKE